MKHLQPGKAAPDIEGADVTGKKMKLSDYRGKVVMLVFWSSSCGPCMAEVPGLRKLMESYAGRPFTVVGVNCDDGKDKAAKTVKDQKMTWPSFWDGEDGPIVERWNVMSLPTVYLIDAKGGIWCKRMGDSEKFDIAVAVLVWNAQRK
jgi:peroxiredoxin